MRHRLIHALASAALLAACGGGGGGDGGSTGGAGPSPSQPGSGSVPADALESMSNFMRFMAAWAADDTVEPLLLNEEKPPPTGDGEALPVS